MKGHIASIAKHMTVHFTSKYYLKWIGICIFHSSVLLPESFTLKNLGLAPSAANYRLSPEVPPTTVLAFFKINRKHLKDLLLRRAIYQGDLPGIKASLL